MGRTRTRGVAALRVPLLLLFLMLAVSFLVLLPGADVHADDSADSVSRDYLLEVATSPTDEVLFSHAHAELGRVDSDSLELVGEYSKSGAALVRAYDRLSAAIEDVTLASTFWFVESAPAELMRSFEAGTVPLASVFAAARDVRQLEDPAQVPDGTVVVQTVEAGSQLTSIQKRIDKYSAALDNLDQDSAAIVNGTFDVANLSSKKLHRLASGGGPLAAEAQLQLDRDLAANLPDLSDEANGELTADLLCPIPWETSERLLCAAMGNFERLNEAYRAEFGTDLPILNGYRTLSEQYYVHAQSPNMTAIPGTSNHGLGQAIDFDWDVFDAWTDPEVVWMIEHGPSYGFRLPSALGPTTDRPEPWHYEFGTSYSDDNSADFLGPDPQVVYRVVSPWNQ